MIHDFTKGYSNLVVKLQEFWKTLGWSHDFCETLRFSQGICEKPRGF